VTTTSERLQRPIELSRGEGGGRDGAGKRPTGREKTMGILILMLALALTGVVIRSTPASSASSGFRPAEASGNVVAVDLTAVETQQTIVPQGPGVSPVRYDVWTFDGTAPGPVVRVHLGDTVRFTLHNASTMGMQHSIDFHAAMTPWANLPAEGSSTLTGNYQPVNPGETKTFDWVAMYPGVFMYHCGTPPVLQHIANGMYGAIVVEPDNLPTEREYVLVNSEFYPSAKPAHGIYVGDPEAMNAADPTYVVWNGVADQYKTAALVARPDEPFRIWVVNVGPTLTSAFHVIGTMFDTYPDGNPANVIRGDQTYNIAPGGAAMFELRIPDEGLYPFVTHAFAYTGLGAVGLIKVDANAPAPPGSYPTLGDPFSAGVQPFAPPASVADVVAPSGAAPGPAASPSPAMVMPTGSAGASPAAALCAPQGTELQVSATASAFDATCLAAPAGSAFTIAFTNNDAGVPHNVSIYTDESATTTLFQGALVTGPTTMTYEVPALQAGTYFFRCDVHPTQMFGTFVVK
jgi:plastocyanin